MFKLTYSVTDSLQYMLLCALGWHCLVIVTLVEPFHFISTLLMGMLKPPTNKKIDVKADIHSVKGHPEKAPESECRYIANIIFSIFKNFKEKQKTHITKSKWFQIH